MRGLLKKAWGNEFFQGGIFFFTASFIGSLLNYLFNSLVGRSLGPRGFGEITALFSYSTVFSVPMLVTTLVIIQKIGAKGEFGSEYAAGIENWFLGKLKKWWIIIALSLVISPLIPRLTNLSIVIGYYLVPSIILSFITSFYGSLVQGLKLFFWFSLIGIIAVIIKLLGSILVALGVDGLTTIILFLFISALTTLLLSHFIIQKKVSSKKRASSVVISKRIFEVLKDKQLILTFFSVLAITLLNNADIVYVKKFFSATDAGIYSSWSLFAKIILYFIAPVSSVSYIFFSSKSTEAHHRRTLLGSLIILFIVAVLSFIFYKYFAILIIDIFFGASFLKIAPYLGLASIFGSLYTVITFINNFFLAKKSKFSLILAFAIPVYLISLFLIPKNLISVMNLNVYFSAAITTLYLVAFARVFIYNKVDGKSRS